MAVFVRVQRDNRPDSANLWYGRAVHTDMIDTDGIADIIQRNCSMKKSDVLAVLTELVEVMTDQLQASKVVRLNGFGAFRIGLKTKGAEKKEEFSLSKNIVGLRTNFCPEGRKDVATQKITRKFLNGCTFKLYETTQVNK